MLRNILTFLVVSVAYSAYVAKVFFSLPSSLHLPINFLLVPVLLGIVIYILCTGERWVRVVVAAAIPVFPMAFAGSFVDTGGINIAYIAPLMIAFALGAGIPCLVSRLLTRSADS